MAGYEDYLDARRADQYGFDQGSGGAGSTGPSRPFKLFGSIGRERVSDKGKKEGKFFVYSAL